MIRVAMVASLSVLLAPALAQQPANQLQQCIVGGVSWKLQWNPKHCVVIDNDAKLRETLKKLGWKEAHPKLDWKKYSVVVDAADAPYGTAQAGCVALSADAQSNSARFDWRWHEAPVAAAPAATKQEERETPSDLRSAGKELKEDIKSFPERFVKDMKATGQAIKATPVPRYKRYAVLGVFPKDVLKTAPSVECRVQK